MTQPKSVQYPYTLLLSLSVIITIAAFLIHEIHSLDVWWQVTIGTDIIDQFKIPQFDHYTAAGMGRPYHDSHWFFQIILAISHRLFGLVGIQMATILIWALTLWFCYRSCRHWVSRETATTLLFIAAMTCTERFLPRPEIITFMMIAIFYQRLQNSQYTNKKDLFIFAVLQTIWANSHGLFVIGPFLVGCYLAETLLNKQTRLNTKNLLKLFPVLCLATLVTPFGVKGWEYALLLMSEAGPAANETLKSLGELSPVFGEAARSAPAFWFFLSLLILSTFLLACCLIKRKVPVARTLILLGLLIAALTGRRNMGLFVLAAAPFAAECIYRLPRFSLPKKHLFISSATVAILVFSWWPLSGQYYEDMNQAGRFGFGATNSYFPQRLPAFLKRSGFQGQIFNSADLGGFYLYHYFPKSLPLVDGRWETYAPKDLVQIKRAQGSPRLWQKLVSRYNLRGLLLGHNSPEAANMLAMINQSSDWKLVYLDYAASFWVRADLPQAQAEIFLGNTQLPGKPEKILDCWLLNKFLDKVGATELRLANIENALSFDSKKNLWLTEKGALEIKIKKYTEAEKSYSKLLDLDPLNVPALNELAFLKYIKGDISSAQQLLRKALKIDPDNQDARVNLRRIRNN